MMAAVFAMQGFGQLASGLVALVVLICFRGSLEPAQTTANCIGACQLAADRMWRIVVGVGSLPACLALYYRITIPETPRYTFDVARDVYKAEQDVSAYMQGRSRGKSNDLLRQAIIRGQGDNLRSPNPSFRDFCYHFGQWKHGKVLLGTCASWFFLDIAFYGLGLNNTVVIEAVGYATRGNVYNQLYNMALGNIIIVCAGALPGYWLTVALIDKMGRKCLQLIGFAVLCALFLVIGFAYHHLSRGGLLGLFIIAQFFFNFGEELLNFSSQYF
jgi:MFS transporter, PHS family, inorganic phosphate transporter